MFYQLTPVAQMQSGWRMSSVCKLHEYVFAVGDIKMFPFFLLIHFVILFSTIRVKMDYLNHVLKISREFHDYRQLFTDWIGISGVLKIN